MNNAEGERAYSGKILFTPDFTLTTPQVIFDAAAQKSRLTQWITSTYANLTTTKNPPPIVYQLPGWMLLLRTLQINYFMPSLPAAPGLEIKANSSDSDRLNQINDRRRNYKRCEVFFLERENSSAAWNTVGAEDLFNYGNRFNHVNIKNPFLTQQVEMDDSFDNGQLAIQFSLKDLSRKIELPSSGDIISVRGSWWAFVGI